MSGKFIQTQTDKKPKTGTYFRNILNRIKKYQVLTFTLSFLFIYRFVGLLILYFSGEETFIENTDLSIPILLFAIPSAYLLQWVVATWIISKNPAEQLREKFYRHHLLTIIIAVSFILDLPYRISQHETMSGLTWIINSFETIIYYAFLSFLWWLSACWVSEKIWSDQKLKWRWYKKVVDKVFILLPPIYKSILGIVFALLLFLLLFNIITNILNYSGSDLKKLIL